MNRANGRLTDACRAKALEAGQWQMSNGGFISLAKMADPHLVNALLKSLAEGARWPIIRPLALEVHRRGLEDYALGIVAARLAQEAR